MNYNVLLSFEMIQRITHLTLQEGQIQKLKAPWFNLTVETCYLCSCVSVDVQHGVCWSLHHPADGALLRLHWCHLQRLLLQVTQHVWLWMER